MIFKQLKMTRKNITEVTYFFSLYDSNFVLNGNI